MRIVKKELLRGRRRINPGDFVRIIMKDTAMRIKNDIVPKRRATKKNEFAKHHCKVTHQRRDDTRGNRRSEAEHAHQRRECTRGNRKSEAEHYVHQIWKRKGGKNGQGRHPEGQPYLNRKKPPDEIAHIWRTGDEMKDAEYLQDHGMLTRSDHTRGSENEGKESEREADESVKEKSQALATEKPSSPCLHRTSQDAFIISSDANMTPTNTDEDDPAVNQDKACGRQTLGFLHPSDVKSVEDNNQLNDNVLEAFIGTEVVKTNGRVAIFSPHVFANLRELGITTETRQSILQHDDLQRSVWIIPMNTLDGLHWSLAVVSFTEKMIGYFDSMGLAQRKTDIELLQMCMVLSRPRTSLRWMEWRYACPNTVNRQTDGSSCGVHICMYVRILLTSRRLCMDLGPEEIVAKRSEIKQQILTYRDFQRSYYSTLSKGRELRTFVVTPPVAKIQDWQELLIKLGSSARPNQSGTFTFVLQVHLSHFCALHSYAVHGVHDIYNSSTCQI